MFIKLAYSASHYMKSMELLSCTDFEIQIDPFFK